MTSRKRAVWARAGKGRLGLDQIALLTKARSVASLPSLRASHSRTVQGSASGGVLASP
jgi:hypothetical protein